MQEVVKRISPYIVRIVGPQIIYSSKKLLGRQGFDEVKLLYELFDTAKIKGTMVDVGAHHGSSLGLFVASNWDVIAFEPDLMNHDYLKKAHGYRQNLIIDNRAVSNKSDKGIPFYASNVSTGISGLSPFDPSHYQQQTVDVTTLTEALGSYQVKNIDFLKIDTEGHDLFVLQGMDWNCTKPLAIICEFENRKTEPLGYRLSDLCSYLLTKEYRLVISEWEPITQYGSSHRWKRFTDEINLLGEQSWGNIVAFHKSFTLSDSISIDDLNIMKNRLFG